jgi:hypothetical protein
VARGLIPFGLPETTQPIIITATGVQPLAGSIDRTNQTMQNATAAANKPAASGGQSSGEDGKKPPTDPVGPKKKVAKASTITIGQGRVLAATSWGSGGRGSLGEGRQVREEG